jgi:uncharacterized protein DUF4365
VTLNDQKCAFSESWLRLLSAVCGFGLQAGTEPDDQSVDFTVASRRRGIASNPRLDVQLKSTADELGTASEISFSLPQQNYDDLRDARISVPIILVVVQVPSDPLLWVVVGDTKVEIFRAAWWISLRGYPDSGNRENTTVKIPQTQRLTPDALREIMIRFGNGGLP